MIGLSSILAVAVAGQAAQPGSPDCVRSLAAEWEASGEPAADIARAVAIECDRRGAHPISLDGFDIVRQNRLRASYRGIFEQNALAVVVRLRACRRTPGCDIREVR